MRVVGGSLKGRPLVAPADRSIRPTTDRARESLFNILEHGFDNPIREARVLDVFAGTGALGIEALSRGAAFAVFMERAVEARALIRRNIEALGLGGVTRIARFDATRPGPLGSFKPFQLIFCDPPYGKELGERALGALLDKGWIDPEALIVLEERADAMPTSIKGFSREDARVFGDTAMGFFRVTG